MNEPDSSIAQYGIGAGAVALVGFLARFVFGGILKRLDDIKTENDLANKEQLAEIRAISSTQHAHTTALALMEAKQARLDSDLTMVRVKVDDTQGWLQAAGFRKRDGIE